MPTPAPRTPICIARGNLADLQASIADIEDGEICYAFDENAHYIKAFGSLTKVGGEFSGDYNDLINRPTIGGGSIVIKQGGVVKGSFSVNQTANEEINLDAGGEGGGGSYTLPAATSSTLGGIKVGTGLSIAYDGTLNAISGDGGITDAPIDGKQYGRQNGAWTEVVSDGGGSIDSVIATPGTGITATTSNGDVTLAGVNATSTVKGVVQLATQADVDGQVATKVVTADLILANAYQLPVATASVLGGVTVGTGLKIDPVSGKLDVTVSQGTVFKGTADFTDSGAEPPSPEGGWIYVNTTAGTAAWTGISGETVEQGVEAIWSADEGKWALIVSAGVGVTDVTGTAPITVDVATNGVDQPIVGIADGSEAAKGAVQFATDAQISSGVALVAVQASQLKAALDGLVIDGGSY